MQQTQKEYINLNLDKFNCSSVKELIERFYLTGIIESYQRINKQIAIENDIRNRFVKDFRFYNPILKPWIQSKILHVNWERWVFKNDDDLGRADLSFELPGIDFIVECKRLRFADKKYIDDGLNRFIELEYGEEDEYAGMLGFVISSNEYLIAKNLKDKVLNVNTVDSDFAKENFSKKYPTFNSTHFREDASIISIYHLFFRFNN